MAISEALRGEVTGSNVAVTVLCPNFMKTSFFQSGKTRQDRLGPVQDLWATVEAEHRTLLETEMSAGLDPRMIARIALDGVRDGRFYVVTHLKDRDMIAARHQEMLEAYDWLAATCAADLGTA